MQARGWIVLVVGACAVLAVVASLWLLDLRDDVSPDTDIEDLTPATTAQRVVDEPVRVDTQKLSTTSTRLAAGRIAGLIRSGAP